MLELLFITCLFILVTFPIWSEIYDSYKNKKEKERLEKIPIEVFKYRLHMYLNDGTNTEFTEIFWTTLDFYDYVEKCILRDSIYIVGQIFVNTENISRIKFINVERKFVKPYIGTSIGKPYVKRSYTDSYVIENEIKKEVM